MVLFVSVQQVGEDAKNSYIIATKLVKGDTTSKKSLDLLRGALNDMYSTYRILSKDAKTIKIMTIKPTSLQDIDKIFLTNPVKTEVVAASEPNTYFINIKAAPDSMTPDNVTESITSALDDRYARYTVISQETVGPAVGDYMKITAVKLLFVAVIVMFFVPCVSFRIALCGRRYGGAFS